MTFSSRLRTTSLVAVLAALALTASACGGSDAKAADQPSTPASTSASPTPTPTPTPTPSAAPLSPFEGKAPVKAARAFLSAVARAVNAGDRSMKSVQGLATPNGLSVIAQTVKSDLDRPAKQPGPQPFTPVNLRVRGGEATISTCMKTQGWSLDVKTGKRWEKPRVDPILIVMKRVNGRWKYDNTSYGTGDCSGVKITEVRW